MIAKVAHLFAETTIAFAVLGLIALPCAQGSEPPQLFGARLYLTCKDEKSVFTKIDAYRNYPANEAIKKTWNVMLSLPTGEMTIDGKRAELQVTKDRIEGNISSFSESEFFRTESHLRMILRRDKYPAFRVEKSPLEMEITKRDGSLETLGFFYYEHEGFCALIN